MWTWGRAVPAAFFALALGLSGCGDDGESEISAESPRDSFTPRTQHADGPILLTQPTPQGGGMDAIVQGVLGINAQGCVVIDDKFVVIAPYGSKDVGDGRTFELTGMGRFRVGETVRGAGGYLEKAEPGEVPSFVRKCFPETGTANYVSIRGE